MSLHSVMKNLLFLLGFFTGIIPLIQSVPCKYYLIQELKTWSDAQAYCRDTHTDLAIIKSDENMVRLQNEAQRLQFSSSAWIGLWNDINSWHWSIGNVPLGPEVYWRSGEPNNSGGNQSCGVTDLVEWYDKDCTDIWPFICFDENKIGTERFIYISTGMTWLDARSYCRQYHTDLTSVNSLTEYTFIKGLIPTWRDPSYTWIGLVRDTWKWTDKTNFSTTSWMSEQLDNVQKQENCGYLSNTNAADALCSDLKPFFCYSEITGIKQTMRLKIRSSQDVNDPALKALILEQIYQKMRDHGMAENITVKWMKQQDGEVFHRKKDYNVKQNCGL